MLQEVPTTNASISSGFIALCSQQLAEKLRLLESKLLQGDQHGSLDQLAVDKEARVQRQKEELRRHKEQVIDCYTAYPVRTHYHPVTSEGGNRFQRIITGHRKDQGLLAHNELNEFCAVQI